MLISVRGNSTSTITWVSIRGIVTFTNTSGAWRSTDGKYDLLPLASSPYGNWLIQTRNPSEARRVWTFESFSYRHMNGVTVETIARLRRHALSGSANNPVGFYGYTVDWTANGTIQYVTDDLGDLPSRDRRRIRFLYADYPAGCTTNCLNRKVTGIQYEVVGSSVAPVTIASLTYDGQNLERVTWAGTVNYRRFRYLTGSAPGIGTLLTQVIGPHTATTPAPFSSNLAAGEVVLEQHTFSTPLAGQRPRATGSSGPGRAYAYEWNEATQSGLQFDLKQPAGSCASSSCAFGYGCRAVDSVCYPADVLKWESGTQLPKQKFPLGASSSVGSGSSRNHTMLYTPVGPSSVTGGRVRSSLDSGGTRTTYGLDSLDRVRCMVRGDLDDEAFAPCVSVVAAST